MQQNERAPNWFKAGASAVVAVILLIGAFAFNPLTVVDAGHAGVVSLFGNVRPEALPSGMQVVNPLAKVIEIDVRQYPMPINGAAAGTKDLQDVTTDLVVNYHADPRGVTKLYTTYGPKFWEIIIVPGATATLKEVTANYNAAELITKRGEVQAKVKAAVTEVVRARSTGLIVVDDVVIKNFGFAKSFTKAVEDKQVADQNAQTAERHLARVKFEAEAAIAKAKGEAEAFRLQSQQLTPQMLQMEAIKKWDGNLPQFLGGNGAVPFITVPSGAK